MVILPNKKSHKAAQSRRMTAFNLARYFALIVGVLAIVFIVMTIKNGITKSTDKRACAEVESTAWLQATILKTHLNDQYDPLRTVSNMLADGETFASESMRPALKAIMQAHELCMFGFADLDGNVTNYEGEPFGNIRDRSYFYEIASGVATQKCEYLATTKSTNEPRMMFSAPAHDENGNLIGVLFISKEISVLGCALFEDDDIFGCGSSYFICDAEGKILVASEDQYSSALIHQSPVSVFETIPELKEMDCESGESRRVKVDEGYYYVSMICLETNGWKVGCIVDEDTVTQEYASTIEVIRNMTFETLGIISVAIGYVFVLALQSISQKRRELSVIRRYNHNYRMLLREINCTVVEYDPENSAVKLIEDSCGVFDMSKLRKADNAYHEYQILHPEFSFDQLKEAAQNALKKRETQTFESILCGENGDSHWLKIILIPILSDTGYVKILGTTIDVTGMHKEFEKMAETYAQVPGGIHRCYLNDPIHLEYYSESLCKLMGYTHDEVSKILGPGMQYTELIFPEDRNAFADFCIRLSKTGGKETLEYRMLCKDGSTIAVADTMEAKRNSAGVMYGYSVVTDLQKYREAQKKLETELAETKANLEDLKIKNFTSQMQPHFLYNALASIREVMLDNPEYASELLCDFTTYLRACLRSVTSDALIPFSQELNNIEAYVRIEKMRFGDRLKIRYECEEQNFPIIPLSIQPLVENAIRHGIYERGREGGTVIVRTARKGDQVEIVVEDNGVGFDYDTTMQEIKDGTRDSTGMFNLIFRFERILNADVRVESRINVGTRITILLPNKKED